MTKKENASLVSSFLTASHVGISSPYAKDWEVTISWWGIAKSSQEAEDTYFKAQANVSRAACGDHSYVWHHCEKNSQENCLDCDKNTIFYVFIKIKLKCFLNFNGIDHVSIIGREVPYSSSYWKWQNTEYPPFFFPKAKTQNKQTLLIKPRIGSTDRTRHPSHSPAIKRSFVTKAS